MKKLLELYYKYWLIFDITITLLFGVFALLIKNIEKDVLLSLLSISVTLFAFLFTAMVFMAGILNSESFKSIRNIESKALKQFFIFFCIGMFSQISFAIFLFILSFRLDWFCLWYIKLLFTVLLGYAFISMIRCIFTTILYMRKILIT